MRAPTVLRACLRLVAEPSPSPAEPGSRAELVDERVPFGTRAFRAQRVVAGVRLGDLDVELRQARRVLRTRLLVEDGVGAGGRGVDAQQREDVHVATGGAEQRGDVVQAFRVGRCASWPVEHDPPGVAVASEHVGWRCD